MVNQDNHCAALGSASSFRWQDIHGCDSPTDQAERHELPGQRAQLSPLQGHSFCSMFIIWQRCWVHGIRPSHACLTCNAVISKPLGWGAAHHPKTFLVGKVSMIMQTLVLKCSNDCQSCTFSHLLPSGCVSSSQVCTTQSMCHKLPLHRLLHAGRCSMVLLASLRSMALTFCVMYLAGSLQRGLTWPDSCRRCRACLQASAAAWTKGSTPEAVPVTSSPLPAFWKVRISGRSMLAASSTHPRPLHS